MPAQEPSPKADSSTKLAAAGTAKNRKHESRNRRANGASRALSRLATRRGRRELREQSPSWATSLLLHIAVLLLLAYVTLPLASTPELSLEAAAITEETFEIEDELLDVDFDMEQDTLEETIDEQLDLQPQIEVTTEAFEFQDAPPLEMLTEAVDFGVSLSDLGELPDTAGMTTSGLAGRTGATKAELLRSGGGTRSSEKAVLAGLDWLARHQYPDGSWNFDHTQSECNGQCANPASRYFRARSAATGLALLCYLGAGHTQEEGRYQRVVLRGIYALGNMFKLDENGASFWDPEGRMYSHGIATMAICEAYALTGDPALREPAQAAINFTCYAQDPRGGGWRYAPRQAGDTSVVGWQIGALKSGYLSNLSVPPQVVQRAAGFLNSMSSNDGSRYYYDKNRADGHAACTAIGALCRMYMGASKDYPGVQNAVGYLSQRGPSEGDVYYNYYAAQALFHYTGGKGPIWKQWNDKMRDQLVSTQASEGHELGSWAPIGAGHAAHAGRLFTTAMSVMTLEVYYRMMPIYREAAVEGSFDTSTDDTQEN